MPKILRLNYTSSMNDQQKLFVESYLDCLRGTEACRRSGYEITYAHQLLTNPEIRAEIDRRLAEKRAQARITVEHIECLLRDMAEVDLLDIFDAQGNVRPLTDIPPHARRAIASIETEEHFITGAIKTKVKLWDKKGAVELLGKYKKMFTDKVEVTGEGGGPVTFTINGIVK